MPPELSSRLSEIESARLDTNFSVNRTSITAGYSTPVAYSAPTVTLETYTKNESTTAFADIANGTSFDVSKILPSLIQVPANQNTLRFSAVGNATLTTDATNLRLTVNYARDADQVMHAIYTPLVLNPKDADVYARVLSVLARVDRDVVTASNTIISKATYDEIKNTGLKNNDDVVALFTANEKLQKDQTLAAVWQSIFSSSNIKITREALEELYLVWQNKLSFPVESDEYTYVTPQHLKYTYDPATWKVYSVNPLGQVTQNTCIFSVGGANYCFLQPKRPSDKPYVQTTSAKFTGMTNLSYGDTLSVDALPTSLTPGALYTSFA